MKKLKYIIIALFILLIILIAVTITLLKQGGSSEDEIEGLLPQDHLVQLETHTIKETNDNVFFTLNDIIQTTVKEKSTFYYGQEVYTLQTYGKAVYYTYGFLQTDAKNKLEDYYVKINVDFVNGTFLEETLTKEEFSKAKNGQIMTIDESTIEKTDNNSYIQKSFSTQELARRYIKDYIIKVRYLPEVAYNLLDNTYQTKKFKNVEEFKKHVEANSSRYNGFVMQKYESEIKENGVEYTVLDQYGNYYKIMVEDTLNYKMILDNYTIEDKEYLEEYNKAEEIEKVGACIAKFIKLVNSKEYSQIYGYLDHTFKKNNFNTVEKFENYMKKNWFSYNIAEIESAEKIEDVYACKVKIKSSVGVSAETKEIEIMMKLLEGTNFTMSFSIK